PLFTHLDALSWHGRALRDNPRWFCMGQVCVAKSHRGTGVFDGMYQALREHCREDFDFTVTSISERNQRSLQAHARVGFKEFGVMGDDGVSGEAWRLVAWDF